MSGGSTEPAHHEGSPMSGGSTESVHCEGSSMSGGREGSPMTVIDL